MQYCDPDFKKSLVKNHEAFRMIQKHRGKSVALVGPSSPRVKKLCFQKSWAKTMLIAYFDCREVIYLTFFPERQTMNSGFYRGVMDQLLIASYIYV